MKNYFLRRTSVNEVTRVDHQLEASTSRANATTTISQSRAMACCVCRLKAVHKKRPAEERKARTVCRVAIDTRPTRLITCTSLIPVGKLQTGAVCRVQYRAGNEFPSHLQIVNVHYKSNNLIDPRANATVPF